MKLLGLTTGCVALLLAATNAAAQTPSATVEGAGIKVGEGTVIHPVIGVATGVVENVFYDDANRKTSGLLQIIAELAVGSLPPDRMQDSQQQDAELAKYGDLAFRAFLQGTYFEYLSSNDNIQAQRNFATAIVAQGIVYPKRTTQFAFNEEFRRETRPVNFESEADINRDINRIGLQVRYRPRQRTLSGYLQYLNVIDVFEDESQRFANRIQHAIGVGAGWQWLPVTRFTADASVGFYGGLGSSSTRPSSIPVRVGVGIATALTVKTSLNAKVGFGKGFYESGPDFTNITGSLQFGYRFSPQALLAVAYSYDFEDSINANFYRDHAVKARIETQRDRFAVSVGGEFRHRLYRGIITEVMTDETDRTDLILSASLGALYNFRHWIAATLDYNIVNDYTDFRYQPDMNDPADSPGYFRQVVMLGVRAAY